MPTITVKDIPRNLHRELKKRAKVNHRSLNREVIATLESSTTNAPLRDAAVLIDEARAVRAKFKQPVSARQLRSWIRAGRL